MFSFVLVLLTYENMRYQHLPFERVANPTTPCSDAKGFYQRESCCLKSTSNFYIPLNVSDRITMTIAGQFKTRVDATVIDMIDSGIQKLTEWNASRPFLELEFWGEYGIPKCLELYTEWRQYLTGPSCNQTCDASWLFHALHNIETSTIQLVQFLIDGSTFPNAPLERYGFETMYRNLADGFLPDPDVVASNFGLIHRLYKAVDTGIVSVTVVDNLLNFNALTQLTAHFVNKIKGLFTSLATTIVFGNESRAIEANFSNITALLHTDIDRLDSC